MYLLTAWLAYLGLFTGAIIAHFAKEELIPGIKYFRALKSALFFMLLTLFLLYLNLGYILAVVCAAAMTLIMSFFLDKIRYINTDMIFYSFFAVVLYETRQISAVYPVIVFIYGIPAASLRFMELDGALLKKAGRILTENIIFVLMYASLYLFFR